MQQSDGCRFLQALRIFNEKGKDALAVLRKLNIAVTSHFSFKWKYRDSDFSRFSIRLIYFPIFISKYRDVIKGFTANCKCVLQYVRVVRFNRSFHLRALRNVSVHLRVSISTCYMILSNALRSITRRNCIPAISACFCPGRAQSYIVGESRL